MISRWLRFLLWQPYALLCRRFPLWPFQVKVTQPVEFVTCIQYSDRQFTHTHTEPVQWRL